ncbi:MAG: tetratricopeptide repeat protein [Planctomycetaceae bacterium]
MATIRLGIASCVLWGMASACRGEENDLAACRGHLLNGRYAEAREALDELEKSLPREEPLAEDDRQKLVMHMLLRSRLEQAEGEWGKARSCLESEMLTKLKSPQVTARRAELAYLVGDYTAAEKLAQEALEAEKNLPLAILIQGHVYAETGRLKEAEINYRDLVRYYNQAQPTDAETLLIIADGAAQYARFNGSTQIFDFIVNTLCPDALMNEKDYWPAHHFAGMMFLEKYNEADASSEFQSALAINFQSAEVLTAIAQSRLIKHDYEAAEKSALEALVLNPHYPSAFHVLADVELWRENTDLALGHLKSALEVNPHDQRTLARVAFCHMLKTGWPAVDELETLFAHLDKIDTYEPKGQEYEKTLIDLAKMNPKPGYALTILGELFENHRRYPQAEVCFVGANRLMPKLPEPKASLAQMYIQIGRLDEGRLLLDAAFKADPYHVRVSNLRKVLDQLEGYQTITTDHFVIRVDGGHDQIFGEALADFLEEVYSELTQGLGYEPPEPTQFDVFYDGDGETAHAWFSARMTGLPWLHTIGASTGKVISLVSPTSMEKPYNWARVARHEFVHIITLQQTEFGIPHWFTEALAVKYESPIEPSQWQDLLRKRVPGNQLFELKNLNDGFQRAKSSEDWQMAYCQSRLYLDFLEQKFGPDVSLDMLKGYKQNLSTEDVVRKACGIELDELERAFRVYLHERVQRIGTGAYTQRTIKEWEKLFKETPDNPDVQINYARALWETGERKRPLKMVDQVLKESDHHELATIFKADLEIAKKDFRSAQERLRNVWDAEHPSLPVLERLMTLQLSLEQFEDASESCRIGREKWPEHVPFMKAELIIADKQKDQERIRQSLEALAKYEADEPEHSKRLCQMAWERKDYPAVIRHGRDVLHVNVHDAEVYPLLGESWMQQAEYSKAAKAFETGWKLDPEKYEQGIKLANCLLEMGEKDKASATIDRVLKDHPDDEQAQQVRRTLKETE